MSLPFTHLTWLIKGGKNQEPKISNGSSLNSSPDSVSRETDSLKFPLVLTGNMSTSSKRVKRKWKSREERKIDQEYDIVLVPSDGGCVSGTESDDSDWSIGWMEPHGPGFHSDDESDDSFAVLVPCYGHVRGGIEDTKDRFLDSFGNGGDIYAADSKKYLEQWLSSLQNS